MLELLLCSLVTILPDYLYRRYRQGKRLGKEINLYSMWFELRWGITGCLVLTVCFITGDLLQSPVDDQRHAVLQDHPDPAGRNRAGRRDLRWPSGPVAKGAPIFRLDSAKQEAAVETARRKVAEIERRDCPGEVRNRQGGRAAQRSEGRPPAGAGRTGNQAGAAQAQSGYRGAARDREARSSRARHHGCPRGRDRPPRGRRSPVLDRASGRAGQRRGRARPGHGGAGQRPSCAPGSAGASSNSSCGWATSSTR